MPGGILGAPTPELLRVAIVGGGLAGLTTTYELLRLVRINALPLEIRLYEGAQATGGIIHTERRDGFLLERGADCFTTENPAALRLAVELGLQEELIPAHVERGMLVWWENSCHPMPPGLSKLSGRSSRSLMRSSLLTTSGKLRAGLERLEPRRQMRSEESISTFVSRRFGKQMLERVADPLLAGFYRGDPAQLSVCFTCPELVSLEQDHGSITRGQRIATSRNGAGVDEFPGVPRKVTRSPMVSFRGGMQTLVDTLADAIQRNDRGALQLGRRVASLRPSGDPVGAASYAVRTADGESWIADICVLAVPHRKAASLVKGFAPEVERALLSVPHASSVSVYLGYDRAATHGIPNTMGCLVPHSQGRPTISCWVVHRKLDLRAPPGAGLLNLQMGGERRQQLLDLADRSVIRVARREVAALFGVKADPILAEVQRWPGAHPQYTVEHAARVERIEAELDLHAGLLIAGSALYGASVPDVVANGRATARVVSDLVQSRLI